MEGGAHVVDFHETVDAVGGGEYLGKRQPVGGDALLGPGDAGNEHQGHGGEDEQQEGIFPFLADKRASEGEKDAREEEGEEENHQVGGAGDLREAEDAGHDEENPVCHHKVDRQVGTPLAEDNRPGAAVEGDVGHHRAAGAAFAGGAGNHAGAEQEGLLDDEDEDGGDDEGCEAACGVKHFDLFDADGRRAYLLPDAGSVGEGLHLDALADEEGDVTGCLEEGLVVEECAHVAVEPDMRLVAAADVAGIVGGDVEDAVDFFAPHEALRLFEVGAMRHDFHAGGGVPFAHEFTAVGGGGTIDDRHGHLAHDFVAVDVGVDEGVGKGKEDEKGQYPVVAEDGVELPPEYVEYVFHVAGDWLMILFFSRHATHKGSRAKSARAA